MVNDFMVCVDRIISSACLRFSNEELHNNNNNNNNNNSCGQRLLSVDESESGNLSDGGEGSSTNNEMKECRICQEEDDHLSLESPCACNGTLKYAHRICIKKWCNKKGDITCEICNQVFTPNYSLPPPKRNLEITTVNISQTWGQHFGFRDDDLLALAAAERQFLESEYNEYATADTGHMTCLRSMAIILMSVLLIHQVLMVTKEFGLVQGYSTFFHFQVSFLQLAGFLLPCYVLARSWYILYTRRRRQG